MYLYGAPFTLYTDHKPLALIYANPVSKPPARIKRWLLWLQQYDFDVVYKTGKDNPADFLSWHPVSLKLARQNKNNIADGYVNEVSTATQEDASLVALCNAI